MAALQQQGYSNQLCLVGDFADNGDNTFLVPAMPG